MKYSVEGADGLSCSGLPCAMFIELNWTSIYESLPLDTATLPENTLRRELDFGRFSIGFASAYF